MSRRRHRKSVHSARTARQQKKKAAKGKKRAAERARRMADIKFAPAFRELKYTKHRVSR